MRRRTEGRAGAWLAVALAILGALGLIGAAGALAHYRSRAVLAQRVDFDEAAASLFGDFDAYVEIGSPQVLVIEDRGAFLPGDGPEGSRLVSEDYLKEKSIYPLQLKTVEFVAGNVRLASGGLLGASALLMVLRWARGRSRRPASAH